MLFLTELTADCEALWEYGITNLFVTCSLIQCMLE